MRHGLQIRQFNLRVLTGWLVLLLYVIALSPAGAAITALVAAASPDHNLQIACAESGVSVVLHHPGSCAAHHHGRASRLLTLLASPASLTDPDHVIQFASSVIAAREAQADTAGVPSAVEAAMLSGSDCPLVSLATIPHVSFVRPPPDTVLQRVCIRTTVLLI